MDMRQAIRLSLACALLACAQPAAGKTPAPLARSHQLVVVTTRAWDDVPGTSSQPRVVTNTNWRERASGAGVLPDAACAQTSNAQASESRIA